MTAANASIPENRPGHAPALRVGYVIKRFPRVPETFILNEILELERQSPEVEVFSLLPPSEELCHEAVGEVGARVTYLPQRHTVKNLPLRTGCYADYGFTESPLKQPIRETPPPPRDSSLRASTRAPWPV